MHIYTIRVPKTYS